MDTCRTRRQGISKTQLPFQHQSLQHEQVHTLKVGSALLYLSGCIVQSEGEIVFFLSTVHPHNLIQNPLSSGSSTVATLYIANSPSSRRQSAAIVPFCSIHNAIPSKLNVTQYMILQLLLGEIPSQLVPNGHTKATSVVVVTRDNISFAMMRRIPHACQM